MPIIHSAKVMQIAGSANPKQEILNGVGDLSGLILKQDFVLVGVYIASGMVGEKKLIHRPDTAVAEDEFQSKVAVVLKKGRDAFDPDIDPDEEINIGDWVSFSVRDGLSLSIKGFPCRILKYERIIMKLDDPEIVF